MIDSLDPIAFYNLGRIYLNTGLYDKACEFCSTATVIKTDYAYAHNCYGVALYNKGNYSSARKAFLRTVTITPNDSIAHFYLKKIRELL